MSNESERIDLTQFEESFGGLLDAVLDGTCTLEDGEGHLHDIMQVIIAELERCYEEIDLAHRNLSIVRNALARGYPDIEEEIWKLIDASE